MDIYSSRNYTRKDMIGKVANVLREERATATNIESAVDKAGLDRDEVNAMCGSMHALIPEMVSDLSGTLTNLDYAHNRRSERRPRSVDVSRIV